MASSESSRQKLLTIAGVVVVALLAINAFLLFNKYKGYKVIETQKLELTEADKLRSELEKQYHQALSDLEALRTDNPELNAIIDKQKLELQKHRSNIENMLGEGGELSAARDELNKLRQRVQQYLFQFQALSAENDSLAAERDELNLQNIALSENLDSTQLANVVLQTEKSAIDAERQQLALERAKLAETVNLASVIKVRSLNVTPLLTRESGRTVKKSYAKNVDHLRVCFLTSANEIAGPGTEYFLIRIINPVGETMAIDELGAGVFISKKSGEEIRFTTLREIKYLGGESELCVNWNPNLWSFMEGKYKVEVYNKGHLAGTGDFELK